MEKRVHKREKRKSTCSLNARELELKVIYALFVQQHLKVSFSQFLSVPLISLESYAPLTRSQLSDISCLTQNELSLLPL